MAAFIKQDSPRGMDIEGPEVDQAVLGDTVTSSTLPTAAWYAGPRFEHRPAKWPPLMPRILI